MILRMNRRYLVTVPSGIKLCYTVIKTLKEQMIWQGFVRAGTCSLTLAPKGSDPISIVLPASERRSPQALSMSL